MAPAMYLQTDSSVWLFLVVALCGLATFIFVVFLRILPFVHKPRVTLRVKPFETTRADILSGPSSPASTAASAPSIHASDRTELLQAKSQWEQLIEEAESNDQLTPEQRKSFAEEGRKRIAEISKQLEELG